MNALEPVTILLADDDPDDRELFAEAFAGLNAKVSSVKNGGELMRTLEQSVEIPDYIFVDLNMPERNGKECVRDIRAISRLAASKVIIYSTSSNAKDIDETFQLGADLYVQKPTSFVALIGVARNVLMINWDERESTARDSFVYMAS